VPAGKRPQFYTKRRRPVRRVPSVDELYGQGGKQAYYWMPDFDEVERVIKELPNRPAVHES
jgi:hypothetical protein